MFGRFFTLSAILVITLVGLNEAGPRRVPFRITKFDGRATCPDFITKPDFTIENYVGVWYEIQWIPNNFGSDFSCNRAIYTQTAPNVMESINSGILPDGSVNIVNGTLTQVDPEEPGRFVNSFAGPDGGYNVIDTDYRTYTSVYSCNTIGNFTMEYAWIYSREKVMTEQAVQRAKDTFTAAGLNVNDLFKPSAQPGDCFYYP